MVDIRKYRQTNTAPNWVCSKYEVLEFLQQSQPETWQKLEEVHGENCNERIIQRLFKELDLRGSLDVFRNGFVDYGIRFSDGFLSAGNRSQSRDDQAL